MISAAVAGTAPASITHSVFISITHSPIINDEQNAVLLARTSRLINFTEPFIMIYCDKRQRNLFMRMITFLYKEATAETFGRNRRNAPKYRLSPLYYILEYAFIQQNNLKDDEKKINNILSKTKNWRYNKNVSEKHEKSMTSETAPSRFEKRC